MTDLWWTLVAIGVGIGGWCLGYRRGADARYWRARRGAAHQDDRPNEPVDGYD